MSEPTATVRATTYKRDGHRCVSCGSLGPLQYQHRATEAMGGRDAHPLVEEGVTSCALCNPRYEDTMQRLALARGWKVRQWVRDQGLCDQVPVFRTWEGRWHQLTRDGRSVPISRARAMGMMRRVYGEQWDDERGLAA